MEEKGSYKSYIFGFIASLVLTLLAFLLVYQHTQTPNPSSSSLQIMLLVFGLAAVQFVVQAVFFLHLAREKKPRWNLTVFMFMLIVVGIVVAGSLWIMYNLDYRHPHHEEVVSPKAIEEYIIKDEGMHHHE